jgi:E3 ubiquitin-protein ligase TRIP12
LVHVLLKVFSHPDSHASIDARQAFLEVFMGRTVRQKLKTASADSPATPFSVLVHKLQDLLSRSEHFEVVTVHQNTFDGNRSSAASMLAKQIRLKLVADDDSEIPKPYRNIMVSIHAIATFKALDDYLRPRISLSERPRGARTREGLSGALAALAAAGMTNPYSSSPSAQSRLAERQLAAVMAGHGPPPPPPTGGVSRTKRSKSKTAPAVTPASGLQSTSSTPLDKSNVRRSGRRHHAQTEPSPPPPPPQMEDDLQNALECADEKPLTEDEEMEDSSALDAIVGDLDEDMEDSTPADPGAVSLEVAAGGKITASSSFQAAAMAAAAINASAASTPSSSARPMSYAAAIQAVPQDWHIEFSLDEKPISNETTIYRAVHSSTPQPDEQMSRSVWSAIHPIKFKRVPGPPPAEPTSLTHASELSTETTASGKA